MKKVALFLLVLIFIIIASTACNGNNNSFDPVVEQEKATEVMNSVLTSFEDQEKLAEGKTRDEANPIAWEKLVEKNSEALSKDLNEEDQKRLLYVLTINKAEDLDNGGTKSNLLFSKEAKIKNISLNEPEETFTFDIERLDVDHTLVTLEKQEGVWKITTVQDPE